jgi:hypothetical protein
VINQFSMHVAMPEIITIIYFEQVIMGEPGIQYAD